MRAPCANFDCLQCRGPQRERNPNRPRMCHLALTINRVDFAGHYDSGEPILVSPVEFSVRRKATADIAVQLNAQAGCIGQR